MLVPTEYRGALDEARRRYPTVPSALLAAQLQQESGWNPNAVSPVGARGLAQFMPATAAAYGVNVADPRSSIIGAAHYDSDLYARFKSYPAALAAYNAGPDSRRWSNPETTHYVSSILAAAGGSAGAVDTGRPTLALERAQFAGSMGQIGALFNKHLVWVLIIVGILWLRHTGARRFA